MRQNAIKFLLPLLPSTTKVAPRVKATICLSASSTWHAVDGIDSASYSKALPLVHSLCQSIATTSMSSLWMVNRSNAFEGSVTSSFRPANEPTLCWPQTKKSAIIGSTRTPPSTVKAYSDWRYCITMGPRLCRFTEYRILSLRQATKWVVYSELK